MSRFSYILFLLVLVSCAKAPVEQKAVQEVGGPCTVKIVVSGKAPDTQMYCRCVSKDNSVTLDRMVNLLDEEEDIYMMSSTLDGQIECTVQTKDSYGPKVKVEIYVNDQLLEMAEDSYRINVSGRLNKIK